VTGSLPEPLPRGELAGRDQLARRTVELAGQEEPVILWQRAIAAEIVPWVGDDGVLIAGSLGIDIPTGHARPYLPPSGQRQEASPARAQALRASLHVHDREYLEHVRFGTWSPPASCTVYWYDSSGNVTIDRGTEEPGPARLLDADADAGGRVRFGICHDLSASLAVGLAGFDGWVLRGRVPSWLIYHPPAGPEPRGAWKHPVFLGSTDRHVVLTGVEPGWLPDWSLDDLSRPIRDCRSGRWVMIGVHDRLSGRLLWGHRWLPPARPDAKTADAADIRGEALLTREGAFIRARHLDDGHLLWSAVPPPRYGGFAGSGRHPASQWARLAAPGPGHEAGPGQEDGEAGPEDLFLHSLTGRILPVRGAFHHTGDDLVLTRAGRTLTCLALPGGPHRSPAVPRPAAAATAMAQGWRIDLDGGYLPPGGGEVSLIATVTMTGPPPRLAVTPAAEVFILDMSAPMDAAWLAAARDAVTAALGRLRSGTLFAIIAGGDGPSMVYPAGDQLAIADGFTTAEASQALATLTTGTGRAAVGRWLRQARQLLEPHPEAIRHAQLLVAHPFSGESTQEVASSIAQCEGLFTCDCRGLGTNWEVSQLRKISSALLGTVDIVPDPQGLEAEIVAMTDSAMSKTAAGMHLRLRPAPGTRIRFVRQVDPAMEDLTGRGTTPADETAAQDYPTGAWRPGETRDYHIGLEAAPGRPACSATAVIRDARGVRPASETVRMLTISATAGRRSLGAREAELAARDAPEVNACTWRGLMTVKRRRSSVAISVSPRRSTITATAASTMPAGGCGRSR